MFDFIAIDWGSVRTGLAFGSSLTGLVIPYTKELMTKNLLEILDVEIKSRRIITLVVGKPTNFKLQNTQVTEKILKFTEALKAQYPKMNLIMVNENNTSKAGKDLKDKHLINHNAAAEIGTRYLADLKKK